MRPHPAATPGHHRRNERGAQTVLQVLEGDAMNAKHNSNWYKKHIEEPLQHIVQYLHNNGINTTCSCGHEMWIEIDPDFHEPNTLHQLLCAYYTDHQIEPISYSITSICEVNGGQLQWVIVIDLWLPQIQEAYLDAEIERLTNTCETHPDNRAIAHQRNCIIDIQRKFLQAKHDHSIQLQRRVK
jgi:hypothetical protein